MDVAHTDILAQREGVRGAGDVSDFGGAEEKLTAGHWESRFIETQTYAPAIHLAARANSLRIPAPCNSPSYS